jgi:hypothetical protein
VRALGELAVVAGAVGLVVVLVRAALAGRRQEERRWRLDTRTRADGTLVVALRRAPGDERIVRELPPGMDPIDLASELQLAREEGELALRELNRS